MLSLRPYQLEAVKAVHEAGCARPLVAWPTGAGKTLLFSQIAKERGGRTLILAHRDELLQQAEDKLKVVWPEHPPVGLVKADRREWDRPIVIGSVQTVIRDLEEGKKARFNTVIVDEAHHAAAKSYKDILAAFPAPLVLGVTATPERLDQKALGFDKIVHSRTLFDLIGKGFLCDLRAKQIALKMDLGKVKVSKGDYQEGDLAKALGLADAPDHVAEAWLKYAKGRPTLVFTPTVALAYDTALQFQKAGEKFEVVEGEQEISERRAILKDFSAGRIRGVVNCGVLLEGYDEPSVGCICVARPTKSRVLYQQMIGRGTRVHPDKADCLILDFVGATTEHDLVTLATLLNVKVETAEAGVQALLDRVGTRQSTAVSTEGEVVAETVDLVTRQKLHWIRDDRRYLLSCGDETLALCPGVEGWDIRIIAKARAEGSRAYFKGLTLEYAQGVAEDYVRSKGAETLAVGGARWRYQVASEAQLVQLRKAGLQFKPGILKGEASDMLSVHFNRRRW